MNTVIVTTREDLTSILKEIMPAATPMLPAEASELEILKRKKMLTTEEVARLYGFNKDSLRNMRSQGRGPAYLQETKRGIVFYEHSSIEAYMAKMRKVTHES